MTTQETKIVCPVCGSEFELAAHTHVATGIVIGKDSNLGTIHPAVSKSGQMTADAKLNALRNAGVDVGNLFSMTDVAGISKLVRMENGAISVIADDDPILAGIMNQGAIPNRRLFRRWVLSQVFHMLEATGGFTEALQRKGYQYQWKMLIEELRVQAKLAVEDPENFADRNIWFNKGLAVKMAEDYITKLREAVKKLRVRRCNRQPYVHLRGQNVFVNDLESNIYAPLNTLKIAIESCSTPESLYKMVQHFYAQVRKTYVRFDMKMSGDFKGAYKGAGAFFAMKNLILFHNCFIHTDSGKVLSLAGSMKKLDDKAQEYKNDGWRLFGMMKKFIADNNIDIKAKMAEWRKA